MSISKRMTIGWLAIVFAIAIAIAIAGCGGGATPDAAYDRARYEAPLTGDAEKHFEAGRAAAESSDWNTAKLEFARVIELAPYSIDAHRSYIEAVQRSLDDMDDYESMLNALHAQYAGLMEADPSNPLFPYIRSTILPNSDSKALELKRTAIEVEPTFAPAWYALGEYSEYLAQFDEAEAHYRKAVELDPENPKYQHSIAALYEHGDWERYRAYSDSLVSAFLSRGEEGDTAAAAALLSRVANRALSIEERIQLNRRATEVAPQDPGAHFSLYLTLREVDPEEAVSVLRKAVESGLDSGRFNRYRWADLYQKQTLLNLGRTLRRAGDVDGALDYLMQALGEDDRSGYPGYLERTAQVEIALAHEIGGDTIRAKSILLDILSRYADTVATIEYTRIASAEGASELEILESIWGHRLKETKRIPEFALPDVNGDTVSLAEYRGQVVLLNFWFPGCAPCRIEFPYLAALADELGPRGFRVVTINGVESENDLVAPVLENYGYPFRGLLSPGMGWVMETFGIMAYPTNYLLGPEGEVIMGPEYDGDVGPVIQSLEQKEEMERWLNSYFDYLEAIGTMQRGSIASLDRTLKAET